MSRLVADCCPFCEVHKKGEEKCISNCEEEIHNELSVIKVDDHSRERNIHDVIRSVLHDKSGNNWKYDGCDFCQAGHISQERSIMIDDTTYDFCSSKCLIAAMGRIYKICTS